MTDAAQAERVRVFEENLIRDGAERLLAERREAERARREAEAAAESEIEWAVQAAFRALPTATPDGRAALAAAILERRFLS